jgi:uncharacterized protein (UPF0332 family)
MITGEEFIAVAAALANGKTEAYWRSAVSRAYYAAFHAAKVAIERHEHVPAGPQAHEFVKRWLIRHGDPEVSRAGSSLLRLHSNRLKSDYDASTLTVTQNDAMLSLAQARAVIAVIHRPL